MSTEVTDLLDEGRVSMETDAAPLVKQFINIEQVTKDTNVDPTNIPNELIGLSSIFARYGLLVAKARIQRDGFKSRRNLLAALLEKQIRDSAITNEEKVTNPQVASRIAGNGRMVEAELALNEAAAVLAACTEARDAVKVKRDMLVQLNKNQQTGYAAAKPQVPEIPPAAPLVPTTATVPVDAVSRTVTPEIPADTLFGTPIAPVYRATIEEEVATLPDISDCM